MLAVLWDGLSNVKETLKTTILRAWLLVVVRPLSGRLVRGKRALSWNA